MLLQVQLEPHIHLDGLPVSFTRYLKHFIHYVLLFDEVLNKKAHQKQPDIHLHFWQGTDVATCYIHPLLMGYVCHLLAKEVNWQKR